LSACAPPFLNNGLRATRLRGLSGILRLDFILSGLNGGAGVGGEAIDGAKKIQAAKITA